MNKSHFLEAADVTEKGAKRFKIRVISAGVSKNGNYYSPAALREAAPLFDGARVLVRSDEEHIQGKGKDFRNLIGRLSNPRFVEGAEEIQADFELIEPNGAIAVKLREAFDNKMTDLFGFSIDASATAKTTRINGQTVREACKISAVKSVDLIVEPGANGGIIDFIEAINNEGQTMSDKEKTAEQTASVSTPAPTVSAADIDNKIRMVEARANAKAAIAASFTARRLAMMKQTEAGSNEVLSIPPAFLLVPPELEESAYNLFIRNTNNDPQYVQTVKPEIVPIWFATDADDWYLAADPADITGLEIGFLDGNEEPELFIQDNPTAGSVFTNDQITYKIRHIYGGAIIDYRAFQGSIVTPAQNGERQADAVLYHRFGTCARCRRSRSRFRTDGRRAASRQACRTGRDDAGGAGQNRPLPQPDRSGL